MSLYWLISVPGEPTTERVWSTLQAATTRDSEMSTNYRIAIPSFKVGTLDALMGLSDELAKHDMWLQNLFQKIVRTLEDLQNRPEVPNIAGTPLHAKLTNFQWDEEQYGFRNRSLGDIVGTICTCMGQADEDLRQQNTKYIALKTAATAMENKSSGTLMQRSINDLVNPTIVVDTENISTVFVVVNAQRQPEFLACYERLAAFVVPRSALRVTQDQDFILYRVVVFRQDVDPFKHKAQEAGFTVRELAKGNQKDKETLANEERRVKGELKEILEDMIRWCKAHYGECFLAWLHLKAIRLYVESILRYGLPPNFLAVAVQPHKGKEEKVRQTLKRLYGHLVSSAFLDKDEDADFFPYVSLSMELDPRAGQHAA